MSKRLTTNFSADDILEVIYTLGEAAAEYRGLTHEGYGVIDNADTRVPAVEDVYQQGLKHANSLIKDLIPLTEDPSKYLGPTVEEVKEESHE